MDASDEKPVIVDDVSPSVPNGDGDVEQPTGTTGDAPKEMSPLDVLSANDDDQWYDGRKQKDGQTHTVNSTALQSLSNYHISYDKYFGWFRGYVRQDWDTISVPDAMNELKADWSELFFDLIYVACIVHISSEASYSVPAAEYRRRLMMDEFVDCPMTQHMARRLGASTSYATSHCDSENGPYTYLVTAFAQFGLMVKAWEGMVYYTSYFVMSQKMDEVFRVMYMICVVSMGIFVHDGPEYCRSFLIAYGFLQIVVILRYMKVYMIPRTRIKGLVEIAKSVLIILVVIIISVIAGDQWCALNYFGVYFGILAFEEGLRLINFVFLNGPMTFNLPLNVPHFSERNGLFVTLILGEAIIASMLADLEGSNGFDMNEPLELGGVPGDQIVFFLLIGGFLMTYFISRLYYDCQPPEEEIIHGEDNHALRRSVTTALLYVYSHQFLFFGLLGLGAGIKITASNLQSVKRRELDVMLPGWSICVIVVALYMIRWAHPFESDFTQRIRVIWVLRILCLLVMLCCPFFWDVINNGVLFLIYVGLLALLLCLDFEGRERIKTKHEEMKHRRSVTSPRQSSDAGHGDTHHLGKTANTMSTWKSGLSKV